MLRITGKRGIYCGKEQRRVANWEAVWGFESFVGVVRQVRPWTRGLLLADGYRGVGGLAPNSGVTGDAICRNLVGISTQHVSWGLTRILLGPLMICLPFLCFPKNWFSQAVFFFFSSSSYFWSCFWADTP